VNPAIAIAELRKTFPELDKRCSDEHLRKLLELQGRVRNNKRFMSEVFADASGYLEENTVYYYLKLRGSRQIKKTSPGRPTK
jgi:hypothetical protein